MSASTDRRVVLAVGAHADDIEFMMGGTVALLVDRGWDAHYLNLASGSAGSTTHGVEDIIALRADEARSGAAVLGAAWHPPLVDDIEVVYSVDLVRKVTAIVRDVRPSIILTQAPDDYMDDHIETSRILASAAFNRGMPNFASTPPRSATLDHVVVYHAQPHGLRDMLRRLVYPGIYVDTSAVQDRKRAALACHGTQADWLDQSQALEHFTGEMDEAARIMGVLSGRFAVAEGWRRHSHLGFSDPGADPLSAALAGFSFVDEDYERGLSLAPFPRADRSLR